MANFSRLNSDSPRGFGLTTHKYVTAIREAMANGELDYFEISLGHGQRLDHIAHQAYGDGRLWWVIAAASNIGWWLQVPAGTRVIVPSDIDAISKMF